MDEDRSPRAVAATIARVVATLGGLGLGIFLLVGGFIFAFEFGQFGPGLAGFACLAAALLVALGWMPWAAGLFALAGAVLTPLAITFGAGWGGVGWWLGCLLLAVITPWWGPW